MTLLLQTRPSRPICRRTRPQLATSSKGLPLSDAVLQWLSEDPREELTDARLPLSSPDPFEAHVDLRLEKLVGTGHTAGGWLAKPMRINGPSPSSSSSSSSPDPAIILVDGPDPTSTYFLKLVTYENVGSVIRESLFFQRVFPHLPEHLRSHLPRYHGTYRGRDGNGYALMFEYVGTVMSFADFYATGGQWSEIEEALHRIGIVHNDVSDGNVLRRPDDGGFCFVDWGRSYLKPRKV
ncbi:BZ3500_MvSof-1268-A1-R1_Chr5-3g08315 [Microbotryum saponariae]|uniref:BZ3500_MvSof-1268-A1-R1_Chr5-3g08315 protein n=1 Tax=Microbotryum saponariae TaxID=289078 RepID=A0A2X0M898_9BASI|nr:BZ3500_MvSof-1268-A1-R1_Chr5-3g08315 [Microbotryum saponariae]SDA08423.1 BZ3501_MvSof-1269-A2-R1_Chr5-3g08043 [Microbotryum saponariae]